MQTYINDIETKDFKKRLNALGNVLKGSKGTFIPNVILMIKDNTLTLRCVNLTLTLDTFVRGTEFKGDERIIALDYKTLKNVISKVKSTYISIEVDDTNLIINDGSKIQLPYIKDVDLQEWGTFNEEIFSVNQLSFLKTLERMLIGCIKALPTKPILQGVNLKYKDDILTLSSTDSYLGLKDEYKEMSAKCEFNITLPMQTIQAVKDFNNGVELKCYVNDNREKVMLKSDDFVCYSRLLAGEYPNLSAIIDNNFNINSTVVKIDKEELKNIIALFNPSSNDDVNTLIFDINATSNVMTIKDQKNMTLNMKVEVKDNVKDTDVYQFAISGKHLKDVVNSIGGDTIRFKLGTKMFNPVGVIGNEKDYTPLIMPRKFK